MEEAEDSVEGLVLEVVWGLDFEAVLPLGPTWGWVEEDCQGAATSWVEQAGHLVPGRIPLPQDLAPGRAHIHSMQGHHPPLVLRHLLLR